MCNMKMDLFATKVVGLSLVHGEGVVARLAWAAAEWESRE